MSIEGFNECSICFEKLRSQEKIIIPEFSIGIVCSKCNTNFPPKEYEVIVHTFNVARGIFNFSIDNSTIIKDVLYDVQRELRHNNIKPLTADIVFQKILKRAQVYNLEFNSFFILNSHFNKSRIELLKCAICHQIITEKIFTSNFLLFNHLVCEVCTQKFSKDEIETIISLFNKYGGYFNEINSQRLSIKEILGNMFYNLKKEEDFSKIIEINEKALHFALIYGYHPKIFMEELKKL